MRTNVLLRDMNIAASPADERRIEVLAQGLPCKSGAQMAVDTTLRSALTARGEARPNAARVDGAIANEVRQDKQDTYPELVATERCVLVVLALETGGRWSDEALKFVEELAAAKAREAPSRLRRSAMVAWQKRWVKLLSVAAARAFAQSLTAPHECGPFTEVDGSCPFLSDVLAR